MNDSEGSTLLGISAEPYFRIADISFFENIFFYWPPASWESYEEMVDDAQEAAEEEEKKLGLFKDHCNYQGWWAEIFAFKVDLGLTLRSCEMGVYDMLVDSGSFGCSESWGYVDEFIDMEI